MNLKPIIPLAFLLFLSLGGYGSEKIKWEKEEKTLARKAPKGMIFIGSGRLKVFLKNSNDTLITPSKNSSVYCIKPFYMQQAEVTNLQYKEFVFWVRDSILRENFAKYDPTFKKVNAKGDSILNWKKPLPDEKRKPWTKAVYDQAFVFDKNKKIYRPASFNYRFLYFDKAAAEQWEAQKRTATESIELYAIRIDSFFVDNGKICSIPLTRKVKSIEDFYYAKIVNVYPDTSCWTKEPDLNLGSRNNMYEALYFSSTAYQNYPLVGISGNQIHAYCDWLNTIKQTDRNKEPGDYRLPTELEWDYVFRKSYPNGLIDQKFGIYFKDKQGCYFANFKPKKGDFTKDAYLISAPVGSFPPNRLGLYDLVGNVAEWTEIPFDNFPKVTLTENGNTTGTSATDDDNKHYQIVKGGSFLDVDYESRERLAYRFDVAHCFIGIRLVRDCQK